MAAELAGRARWTDPAARIDAVPGAICCVMSFCLINMRNGYQRNGLYPLQPLTDQLCPPRVQSIMLPSNRLMQPMHALVQAMMRAICPL